MKSDMPPAGTPVDQKLYNTACRKIADLEEKLASLTQLYNRNRRDANGCACLFEEDGETYAKRCSFHAAVETERNHLQVELERLRDINQGQTQAIAELQAKIAFLNGGIMSIISELKGYKIFRQDIADAALKLLDD